MEGTAGDKVGTAALERHEIAYDIVNSRGIEYYVNCLLGYHDAISQRNLMRTSRISISS